MTQTDVAGVTDEGQAAGAPAPARSSRSPVRGGTPLPADARETAPWVLRAAAAWSWRILVVGTAVYLLLLLMAKLRVIALSVVAALFLTALLRPLAVRLRRHGAPRLLATWATLLLFLLLVAGLVTLLSTQVSGEFVSLQDQVGQGVDRVRDWLVNGPLSIEPAQIDQVRRQVGDTLRNNRQQLTSGALAGATVAAEIAGGLLLALFTTFFLLYDGERIWRWTVRLFPQGSQQRADEAGSRAWTTLTGYIRGTFIVAAVDAVFIGLALVLVRVPLVLPLMLITFLAAFIPLAGATIAGVLSVLVALVARGPAAAVVIALAVLAVQQLEGHVLQPLVLGRTLNVHPLAIVLSLAAGAAIAGIPGAVVAVPTVAVLVAVVSYLVEGRRAEEGTESVAADTSGT